MIIENDNTITQIIIIQDEQPHIPPPHIPPPHKLLQDKISLKELLKYDSTLKIEPIEKGDIEFPII